MRGFFLGVTFLFLVTNAKDSYIKPDCIYNSDKTECLISYIGEVDPNIPITHDDVTLTFRIENSTLTCTSKCKGYAPYDHPQGCCSFYINVPMKIVVKNSTLRFSTIHLQSGTSIEVDKDSFLDATGTGYQNGPGHSDGNGTSYAAQGGYCLQDPGLQNTYGSYNMIYNDPSNVTQSYEFGSGGGNPQTLGGGRIIIVGQSLTLNGQIDASGFPLEENSNTTANLNGGSGGYVYIGYTGGNLTDISQSDPIVVNSMIYAKGGIAQGTGMSGSGGRIIYDISPPQLLDLLPQLSASGGIQKQALLPCTNGGAGTIYDVARNRLIISGDYEKPINAKTIIDYTDISNSTFKLIVNYHV